MNQIRLQAAALAVLLAASGCGGEDSVRESADPPLVTGAQTRLIAAPRGVVFRDPVWSPKLDSIVFTDSKGQRLWDRDLAQVKLDGTQLRALPVADLSGCPLSASTDARVLPDERIAFLQHCYSTNDHRVGLLAFDPDTRTTKRLGQYALPFGPGRYDFAPDRRIGILNDGQGLTEKFRWIDSGRLVPLEVPLDRAGSPRWSPDGKWIAFGAAPTSDERTEGLSRLDLPQSVFLVGRRHAVEGARPGPEAGRRPIVVAR